VDRERVAYDDTGHQSNVVEKCILFSDDEERRQLTDEILLPRTDGTSVIGTMLKDQFANYPLQVRFDVALSWGWFLTDSLLAMLEIPHRGQGWPTAGCAHGCDCSTAGHFTQVLCFKLFKAPRR
jgi:hypothetical protein